MTNKLLSEDRRTLAFDLLLYTIYELVFITYFLIAVLLSMEILNRIGDIDLGLFIPSMILVAGSFAVYFLRRRHDRQRLESALYTEIKNLNEISNMHKNFEALDSSQKPPASPIPLRMISPPDSFPTTVYEQNVSELGSLDSEKASEVVTFYSKLAQLKSIISHIQSVESKESSDGQRTIEDMDNADMAYQKRLNRLVGDLEEEKKSLETTLQGDRYA